MGKALTIVVAAGMVIAAAVTEGVRSNRWGNNDDIQAAVARLDGVPSAFGDWVGTEVPIDEKVLQVAEAAGNVSRVFVNRKTHERVSVLLLCGPTGPIGAHTPEACYGGMGYTSKGAPVRKGLSLPTGEGVSFWTARFEKPTPTDAPLRVYWGWSRTGKWEASSNPRTEFAWRTVLYKLYVVEQDSPTPKPGGPESPPTVSESFMQEFLPLVKTALSGDGKQS